MSGFKKINICIYQIKQTFCGLKVILKSHSSQSEIYYRTKICHHHYLSKYCE